MAERPPSLDSWTIHRRRGQRLPFVEMIHIDAMDPILEAERGDHDRHSDPERDQSPTARGKASRIAPGCDDQQRAAAKGEQQESGAERNQIVAR